MAVGTVSPGIRLQSWESSSSPPPAKTSFLRDTTICAHPIPRASTSSPTGGPWGWPPHSHGPRSSLLQPSFSRLQALHPLMGAGQASSTPFKRDPSTGHSSTWAVESCKHAPSIPAQTLDTTFISAVNPSSANAQASICSRDLSPELQRASPCPRLSGLTSISKPTCSEGSA